MLDQIIGPFQKRFDFVVENKRINGDVYLHAAQMRKTQKKRDIIAFEIRRARARAKLFPSQINGVATGVDRADKRFAIAGWS
jgi:predicted ATPase with chaperone activity